MQLIRRKQRYLKPMKWKAKEERIVPEKAKEERLAKVEAEKKESPHEMLKQEDVLN